MTQGNGGADATITGDDTTITVIDDDGSDRPEGGAFPSGPGSMPVFRTGADVRLFKNMVCTKTVNGGLVCTAPNNGPTFKQKNQNCLNQINNTPDGKFYNFFSPLSMVPGIGPEWKSSIAEDVGGGAAKFGVFKFFQGASQTMVRTPFGSMSGFVADSIEGVAEGVLAPVAAAATVGQLTVHAGCAISAAF